METSELPKIEITDREKSLVKESWKLAMDEADISNQLLFYDAFFATSPEAKEKYFHKKNGKNVDFQKLSRKFHKTMDFIAENTDDLEKVSKVIMELGMTHNKLKIDPIYYSRFNDAIIKLLDEVLENRFTNEIEQSWRKVLDHISHGMKNAPEKKPSGFQSLLDNLFGKH